LHGVDSGVANFALGHKPKGEYRYDKSHLEPKWCEIVEKELGKVSEVLNLRTGLAREYYATKEDELRAKILKDFIRMGLESGDFTPEIWTAPVLKIYLKKLGISAEKWIEVADDEEIPQDAWDGLLSLACWPMP